MEHKKLLCNLSIGGTGTIVKIDHPTTSCALSTMCCGIGGKLTLKRKIGDDLLCVELDDGKSTFCIRKSDAAFIEVIEV